MRSNEQFFYTYDALGRVTNVNAPSGTADTSYTYDLHNNLISVTSDGRTITNGYNALGDHLSQAGPNGTVSYQYDAAGRLASLVEDLSGTSADLTVSFDHNHSGQIIERSVSNASYTYAHSITIDTLFDHNGLNQITSADDGTSVLTPSYDARGNLTSYDGRTFGYDTYNRLTSVGGTGGSISLEYDPLGRLWAERAPPPVRGGREGSAYQGPTGSSMTAPPSSRRITAQASCSTAGCMGAA